ncbi:MAG: response regulator [Proteobacteria bacterium]|nr:response regulator [Pseudomonadota bacterium]MBU1649190.1 response regulator [Pseudomonadota bacterium]
MEKELHISSTVKMSGNILIVDDEEKNRKLLKVLMQSQGYQTDEAGDGEQALERVRENQPDVILLDVMMPKMDGFEVCRRLKGSPDTAHIPILMITMLTERADRLTGIKAGADDFLSKPVDFEETTLRVKNALYTKHLFDENISYQQELEQKVEAQTHELRKANLRLKQQVKELEGRDRLARLQLQGRSLDDTYGEILQTLAEAVDRQQLILYVSDASGKSLEKVSTLNLSSDNPAAIDDLIAKNEQKELTSIALREKKIQKNESGQAAIPILHREEIAGVILVSGPAHGTEDDETLNILWRMGHEVAMVLRMARISDDLLEDRVNLDELLNL